MSKRPVSLLLALALGLAAQVVHAAPPVVRATDDATVAADVERILTEDVAEANFGEAKKKLRAILAACKGKCSPTATAQVTVAQGIISAQIGQADEAKATFIKAMEADPNIPLPEPAVPPAKAAWVEAQKAYAILHPPADDIAKAGWTSKEAIVLAKAAAAAEVAGNLEECIEKDKAALLIEENGHGRLHLAGCEQRNGKVLDGLRDAQKAMELVVAKRDLPAAKAAQARIAELLPRIAHITFDAPRTVTDLKVNFDDRGIPENKVGQRFSIDPGKHRAKAEGSVGGVLMQFDQTYDVKDGESLQILIKLRPTALTPGQLECMVTAKTQEDIVKCLPQEHTPLVVKAGMEVSAYTDSTSVHVLSPGMNASVISPTQGWNVHGSYLVDVVTAASPDIVSEASRSFHDTRHAVGLGGGFKPGRYGAALNAFYSREHDYLSLGAGLQLSADFFEKQLTLNGGIKHVGDTIGRTGTSFDDFSHSLATNLFDGGATIIMSPSSVLSVGGSLQLERGDQSKVYRYVPMFAPEVSVGKGASIGTVNEYRLPIRPLEQLPLERDRYAISARYAKRYTTSTLRIEERLYTDSWGVKATTTDARYIMGISPKLDVWPHLHVHAQTGANFYSRNYHVLLPLSGAYLLPPVRTNDRELTPLISATVGGGGHYWLSNPAAKFRYGVSLTADVLYTQYLDVVFIKSRIGYYGTLGFNMELE